jgi:hypothetical protein
MTLADYSKFMLCDKFCIQWLLPCLDVLECVINTIQYNTIQYSATNTHATDISVVAVVSLETSGPFTRRFGPLYPRGNSPIGARDETGVSQKGKAFAPPLLGIIRGYLDVQPVA